MNKFLSTLLVASLGGSALAHHSNDYHFDRNVGVTVAGAVKAFRFINPHARLLVDVAGEDGEVVTWDCEIAGANGLVRRGWTQEIFQPGDEIVIQGFAARRHPTECYFDTAELSDGRRIALSDSFESSTPVRGQPTFATPTAPGVPNFSPRLATGARRGWGRAAAGRAESFGLGVECGRPGGAGRV